MAADRLARARSTLASIAEGLGMPVENLIPPDAVRRWAWEPTQPVDAGTVADALASAGARRWQIVLCADALAATA